MQLITDFLEASEVRNLVQLKGYFKGSSTLWDHVLDNVMHHDIALSALGGLISHLSRLMVSLPFLKALRVRKIYCKGVCCL